MRWLIAIILVLVPSCAEVSTASGYKFVQKPEFMSLRIGGAFGKSFEIIYDRRELRYFAADNQFLLSEAKPVLIKPSDQEWEDFFKKLDSLKVWKWKRHYIDPDMSDGTTWEAFISYSFLEPKDLISYGSNAYPPDFRSFLSAVSKLIGGRDFR